MNSLYPFITAARHRMEVDGDGVTTLVAGAGCPLRCKYCINKEVLDKNRFKSVTPEELYDIVKVDDLYFQATGGGLTFGGGESLLHASFIADFRALIGDKWKLNVETSLWVPSENVRIAAQVVDFFIVDMKSLNPEVYESYTGQKLDSALDNLKLLLSLIPSDRILVRVPLIPEYNDSLDQDRSEKLLKDMGVTKIDRFEYKRKDLS